MKLFNTIKSIIKNLLMDSVASYDNNILNLPCEVISMILDKMSDSDLIQLVDMPELGPFVVKLLKERLNGMEMENFVQLYVFDNIREDVCAQFNQMPDIKYKTLKNIHADTNTSSSIRNAIEVLIADYFVKVVGQGIPVGMNFIMQVDAIRSVLLIFKFMDLVDNNGGLFNVFDASQGPIERNLTGIVIKLVNTDIMFSHSYQLNFDIGLIHNKVRVARGDMIEGSVEFDFNSIFMRLFESITQNYSFHDMTIRTLIVGNHNNGRLNEEFEY